MGQGYEGDDAARANSNKRKGREEINMAIEQAKKFIIMD